MNKRLKKGHGKLSEVIVSSNDLIYVKSQQIVYFTYTWFTIYKLYLNKNVY